MLAASGVINSLTDWLDRVSGNWWFLAVILVIALLDSVIPVVPSETTVIIGGVAASSAGVAPYSIVFVIIVGAVGAFIGDNLSYQIGRRASGFVERRAAKKESTAKKLHWAAEQIEERGGLLLITARFIPGGRTVLTLSSGLTQQPQRWFMGWVGVATIIWASYAGILGYAFGTKFEDDHTTAFLLAFGAALAVTAFIELVRFVNKKRSSRSNL
ncbi:MAG: hypothetical protein RL688_1007 [Actinomycetota bacterium]